MKKLFLLSLFATTASYAALPPLAQSSREIERIMESRELYQKLSGAEAIEQILRSPSGYLIKTAHQQIQVNVIYTPSHKIGPAEFTLSFEEPTQINSTN